tara:strand:+ start:4205 stop:5851 length:1647 start_codon:yes stop_codon:yes gene_type:complete
MNIGIDFDNTIVKYDSLFHKVAINENFLKRENFYKTKTEIRNFLRSQPNGEKSWMKLQGLVYGKYMHSAEIMPGVGNFLVSCKNRDLHVFIVSHKTEFGHFDKEKISLRSEALKWMKMHQFFNPNFFGINPKDIFFADTRNEKVKMIAELNCTWFIDDLPEVFNEEDFPPQTKKILFGYYNPREYKNLMVTDTWRKIPEIIFKVCNNSDITHWCEIILNKKIKKVKKILGRGNSSIFKISLFNNKSYAIKYYPDQQLDSRPRLDREFIALELLSNNKLNCVPKPINKNSILNIGAYEWINGEKIENPTIEDMDQVIDFVKKLMILSNNIKFEKIDKASEACLSYDELIHQIEKRFIRLQEKNIKSKDLSEFLNTMFYPLWNNIKEKSSVVWPEESRGKNLHQAKQILSPSDFGFHNCLKGDDGYLKFIDFEYFGWDDPVKLTADFIWHPGMNLNSKLKKKWKSAMIKLFVKDNFFIERLNIAMPIYGMRWIMIILNDFLPEVVQKRKEIMQNFNKDYDIHEIQKKQLKKSKEYYKEVENIFTNTILAP